MKTRNHSIAAIATTAVVLAAIGAAPSTANAQRRPHRLHRTNVVSDDGVSFNYPVAPGELGRLNDRYRDYYYRNSNGNVFRSSRQFSPTGNAFRSSRHYQQKLAASYDGYPVRTYNRYTEGTGRRARERVTSFAHHGQGYPDYLYPPLGYDGPSFEQWYAGEPNVQYVYVPVETARPRPRTREEIPMEPIRLEPPRPVQKAVMHVETLPDGTTRTVIRNGGEGD